MEVKFRLSKKKGRQEPKRGWRIQVDVTWNCLRLRKSTGEVCREANWNAQKELVNSKADFAYLVNERLHKIKTGFIEYFYEQRGKIPTEAEVDKFFDSLISPELEKPILVTLAEKLVQITTKEDTKPPKSKKMGLIELIKKYQFHLAGTEDPKVISKLNYVRGFNQTVNWLTEFRETTKVEDVNAVLLSDFHNFLFDAELEHNTVHGHIKNIKTVLGYANDFLDIKIDKSYAHFKFSAIEPDIVFLLPSEINKLQSLTFGTSEEEQQMEQARDFFVFGCYVGARYGDLIRFTQANLIDVPEGKILRYRPQKTPNKTVSIFLVQEALTIVNKYANDKRLLPKFENDTINALIKPIAKRAGITSKIQHTFFTKKKVTETFEKWERLTMHCSRHTFATICFMSGMSEITVQHFLGHNKSETTKRYVHLADAFKIEAIKNAWAKE